MNTSPNETMVHGADFAARVQHNQQQLGARGALVRPLGAFERMYHRYEQKSTMHFCVVAELADDLDPSALDAALLAVQQRHPLLNVYVGDHPQHRKRLRHSAFENESGQGTGHNGQVHSRPGDGSPTSQSDQIAMTLFEFGEYPPSWGW
jgi:hypothetical protein